MKCSGCSAVECDIGISWLRRKTQNEENTAINSNENKNQRQEKEKIHRHYNEQHNIAIIILTIRTSKILRNHKI
jgi:hypothetical protein